MGRRCLILALTALLLTGCAGSPWAVCLRRWPGGERPGRDLHLS